MMQLNFKRGLDFCRAAAVSASLLLLTACATTNPDPRLNLISEGEYRSTIGANTQNTKIYDGFMNILDVSGTLLTPKVLSAQADHNARIYQWNPDQYGTEKAKLLGDITRQGEIFLSFFVPDRKHDDLHKKTSKWKVFLDFKGRRIEPSSITRIKGLLVELQSLYPHQTRWHTAYKLTFAVPANELQETASKLIITGPVASASLEFPANP